MVPHDNNFNDQDADDLLDLALAREVRNLDRDIQPPRDLWPGIERSIANIPQRDNSGLLYRFMPYGVAASLIMAVTALVLSLDEPAISRDARYVTLEESVNRVQDDFLAVRNPSFQQFEKANRELDPETIKLLYRNVEIIEKARKEIELALEANPESQRLLEMLLRVHEQELNLLNQSYVNSDNSSI